MTLVLRLKSSNGLYAISSSFCLFLSFPFAFFPLNFLARPRPGGGRKKKFWLRLEGNPHFFFLAPPPLGQIHGAFPYCKSQINLIGIGQARNGKGKGKGKGKGNKENERESPALCCKATFQDFLDVCKSSNLHNVVFCILYILCYFILLYCTTYYILHISPPPYHMLLLQGERRGAVLLPNPLAVLDGSRVIGDVGLQEVAQQQRANGHHEAQQHHGPTERGQEALARLPQVFHRT